MKVSMTKFIGKFRDLKPIIDRLWPNGLWIEDPSCYTLLAGRRTPLFEWHPKTGKITFHVEDRTSYEFAVVANRVLQQVARSKRAAAKPKPPLKPRQPAVAKP
jgi:hypothetical protein